jgi:hypothetical protein
LTVTQYPYLYDNGYFTFYLDFCFRLSLRRLLPDLIVYRSNTADVLSESGTAYPSRAPQFIPGFLVSSVLLIILVFYAVLLCVFTFGVPCCDVRYDFRIQWCSVRLFPSRRAHCLIYVIFVCLRIMVSNTFCVLFLICLSSSCCKFLWIDHVWRSLRYYITFICDVLVVSPKSVSVDINYINRN